MVVAREAEGNTSPLGHLPQFINLIQRLEHSTSVISDSEANAPRH